MKKQDKEFVVDFLKALDIGFFNKLRKEADYLDDMKTPYLKNMVKAVKYLKEKGYSKTEVK